MDFITIFLAAQHFLFVFCCCYYGFWHGIR